MRKILSLVLSIAMIISMFTFAMPTTTQAASGITNSYDGSTLFGLDKAAANNITRTFGHGGIGGKAADDVAGYVKVPDGVSLSIGGGSFTTTPWYPASAAAAATQERTMIAFDVMFTDLNTLLAFEYQGIETLDSTDVKAYGSIARISPADGVKRGLSALPEVPENAPKSLSLNEWHNIAVEVANNGTNEVNIYIDGVKYECGMSGTSVGTYRFRMNVVSGSFYVDNYYCYTDVQAQDMYPEENFSMEEITVAESDKVSYNASEKQFTILDDTLTVAELKEAISTDYDIAVYTDATYSEVMADDAQPTIKSIVVVSKDSKAFRYYDFYRDNLTNFDYKANGDGLSCTVTGFKSDYTPVSGSVLEIPAEIAGYPVTGISSSAFRVGSVSDNNKGLYLPNGLKFSEIKMPDTVKTIGNYAFYDTYAKLDKWPADLESIGGSSFVHGGAMTGEFPAGLKTIGIGAFNFSGIKTPVFPDGLESISDSAFVWCASVTEFIIPDSVTSLGKQITDTSYGIKKIRFPRNETLTELPEKVIHNQDSYSKYDSRLLGNVNIYIPETITTIPRELLRDFKDGANVTIFGAYGSAAYQYYLDIKAELEAGTYFNNATYPDTATGNGEDSDKDGKGEIGSITFAEYDFVNDVGFGIDGVNTGDTKPTMYTITNESEITAGNPGNGGKLADDVVIKINTKGGSVGENYINSPAASAATAKKGGVFYTTIQVQAPSVGAVDVSSATFTTSEIGNESNTPYVGWSAWRIAPGEIKVAGTKVCNAVPGRWYTITTEIKNGGSTEAAVYINGVKYDITLKNPSYGVRHFRIAPAPNADYYDVYYDNWEGFTTASKNYNVMGDKAAKLTAKSDAISVYEDGIVYADKEATYTVAQLKEMLETDAFSRANIRIYSDNTFETVLADDENVTNSSVVVVAATNGFAIEKTFTYYPVNPPINTTIFDFAVISEADKTAKVTGFYKKNIDELDDLSAIYIPEEILGYTITEIGEKAFYQNRVIQSVTLPDTITKVGANAFGDVGVDGKAQGKITTVKLSKNLKEIGAGAFQCNPITEIEFPDGLETIGDTAFYWTNLKSISLPDTVKSVGTNAFRLTSAGYVKLSGGVTEYTKGQFSTSYASVGNIVIPASVTNIGVNVFRDTSKDSEGNVVDNTSKMSGVTVYGVKGTYAEEYAAKYGFDFTAVNANTVVTKAEICGDGNKALAGTDFDLRYGYKDLTFKANLANIGNDDVEAIAILVLYDENGAILAKDIEDVKIPAGETAVINETTGDGGVSIDIDELKHGYTAKAFIWRKSNNEPVCGATEFMFDASNKEVHVLLIANSFGNDSFGYINNIAKADGVVLKVQNMYIGGAPLTGHYKNMSQNILAYTPVINGVYGAEKSASVDGALTSDKWDVVALQCASHGFSSDYSFVDYETWADDAKGSTTGTPNITTDEMYTFIKDYVAERAPQAKRVMHMSWSPCEEQSKVMYDARFKDEENARDAVFNLQKDAYLHGSSIFAEEEGMMVPTSYAIWYALNELGFAEHSGEKDPSKNNEYQAIAGEVSLFRDETCHLTAAGTGPYGRVLAGLTWYEYLTGNDARENKYTNSSIPADVMTKLKEAAHWANTQVVPLTGSAAE